MVSQNHDRIILDDSVFREEFVPAELTGRQPQLRLIEACLEPAKQGRKPVHMWLHGGPGSGKTAVAKAALARLKREVGVDSVLVNCWEKDSLYEILDQMVADLKIFHAEEHRSSVKLDRLKRHLGDRRLIILLDEIDKMPQGERSKALYALDGLGNTGLICVSNTLGSLLGLEERVRSRIHPRTISFDPYSAAEIAEILARRSHLGLVPRACPNHVFKRIARACLADARVAIQTFRNAAESAEQAGRKTVTPSDVRANCSDTQLLRIGQVLARLTEDHRMLYRIVLTRKAVLSTDLWQAYLQDCSGFNRKPIAVRTFSSYITQLTRLCLLTCERARVKGNVRLLKMGELHPPCPPPDYLQKPRSPAHGADTRKRLP